MPGLNSVKQYTENGYYHVYNRGVEKRRIFQDSQDYAVFLSYLKEYLSPKNEDELRERLANPDISYQERRRIVNILKRNNFADEITLLAYCLMPNHFHLFIQQKSALSLDKFMNSLATRYTIYFNKKNKRVGSLYQDVYKAVLIENESHFIHLSRYIHRNPLVLKKRRKTFEEKLQLQPSSYPEYTESRNTPWIHPEVILEYFSKHNPSLSYQSFIREDDAPELIHNIVIDNDF